MKKLLALLPCLIIPMMAPAATDEVTTAPPNILFIIADDLGTHLGCYGDKYVRTPVMDTLAGEGVRFDNAWVAQASCSPSRSAIMTGLYPHQTGQIGLAHRGFSMSGDFDTIPLVLKKAGYVTGVIGKVHVKPESSLPFDYKWEPGKDMDTKDAGAMSARMTEFLQKTGDKPFFMNLSYTDPHRPFPSRHKGLPEKPLRKDEVGLLPFMTGLEDVPGLLDEVRDYYNSIMRLDALVGGALDQLRAANRLDNTVIVLIGDHGAPFGRAKVTCYHPGLNVPFIVKWPGVSRSGTSSKALVSTIDLLPTFMDIAGVEKPEELPGLSLRKVVEEPATETREFLMAEFTAHLPQDYYPRRTIRDERFQLIANYLAPRPTGTPGIEGKLEREAVAVDGLVKEPSLTAVRTYMAPPKYELYDLQQDSQCFYNLADKPEHAETVTKMLKKLHQWRVDTDDPLLLDGELKRLGDEIKNSPDYKAAVATTETVKAKGKGKKGDSQ